MKLNILPAAAFLAAVASFGVFDNQAQAQACVVTTATSFGQLSRCSEERRLVDQLLRRNQRIINRLLRHQAAVSLVSRSAASTNGIAHASIKDVINKGATFRNGLSQEVKNLTPWSVDGDASYSWHNYSDANSAYKNRSSEMSITFGYAFTDKVTFNVEFGRSGSQTKTLQDLAGNQEVTNFDAKTYSVSPSFSFSLPANITLDISAGWSHTDNSWDISSVKAAYDTQAFNIGANLTGSIDIGQFTLSPFAGLSFVRSVAESYGDNDFTNYAKDTTHVGATVVGAQLSRLFELDKTTYLQTGLRVSGSYVFLNKSTSGSGDKDLSFDVTGVLNFITTDQKRLGFKAGVGDIKVGDKPSYTIGLNAGLNF